MSLPRSHLCQAPPPKPHIPHVALLLLPARTCTRPIFAAFSPESFIKRHQNTMFPKVLRFRGHDPLADADRLQTLSDNAYSGH
ncbi:hypothetical protein HYPSUDRAFT_245165 [Hypholoma sublateritium FD-334 SS-4]|uniref:Uncharacterized protein n=1 Tax=Hypholoma sublateritium (strain FD-334 SS-4) TaxID=945553 RepID=A0A0D2QE66_HYPSF|nr:hypothetical protein HYPSUDRAFT_245165 [Hypholoma sublateritium FD-334 SS-4]